MGVEVVDTDVMLRVGDTDDVTLGMGHPDFPRLLREVMWEMTLGVTEHRDHGEGLRVGVCFRY